MKSKVAGGVRPDVNRNHANLRYDSMNNDTSNNDIYIYMIYDYTYIYIYIYKHYNNNTLHSTGTRVPRCLSRAWVQFLSRPVARVRCRGTRSLREFTKGGLAMGV